MLYIGNHLNYKIRKDLSIYKAKELESIFIEIIFPKISNIIVGCIYKHPFMDPDKFSDTYLTKLINSTTNSKKPIILTGDFNFNLLKYGNHSATTTFLDLLFRNSFMPLITQPTRITSHSKTLIDNIFINSQEFNTTSGNITSTISDHLPQFTIINNLQKNNIPPKHNIYKRNFKEFFKEKFTKELNNTDWTDTLAIKSNDVNKAYNSFLSTINNLLDKYAPEKKLNKKEYKLSLKPWITQGIQTSIKLRDKFYKKYINEKNLTLKTLLHSKFKTYRNNLVELIKKSKNNYYKYFFESNKLNLKNVWKGINSIINNKSKNSPSPTCIIDNNKTITDPKQIANSFNNFFTNVSEKIQSKIRPSNQHFSNYLKNACNSSLFIKPTTPSEVMDLISNLKIGKSVGPFSIPTSILQLTKNIICFPLTEIINLSFLTGTFPDNLKIAKIIPIFKNDSKLSCNNYRPISLLSNISKIFEKLMYSRVHNFLDSFKCLYELQFGFRSNTSTNHALISITETIREAIDSGSFACGVFIDLQKAFDTVDHSILLSKLYHYGIRGASYQWFKSYLSDRKQFVSINGFNSSPLSVKCGVPQGSILGPLLFLIYINDLHQSIKTSTVHHFADDTNILHINKSYKKLCLNINHDLTCLSNWLRANKLALNVKKNRNSSISFNKKNNIKQI